MLASISTDYYTRVEQGRIGASAPLLATLARALRLNEDQAAYMYERAGRNPSRPRARGRQRVRPQMKRLLDLISDAPAMVQRRNFDILLWNPLAAALMIDFSRFPENDRNFVRLLFTEPALRELYPEWDELARMNVAYLRMEAAENPDIPGSPPWSGSCRSRIPASASGGPATMWRASAAGSVATTIRLSVT